MSRVHSKMFHMHRFKDLDEFLNQGPAPAPEFVPAGYMQNAQGDWVCWLSFDGTSGVVGVMYATIMVCYNTVWPRIKLNVPQFS